MRSHAKASAVGSTQCSGTRRGALHFALSSCVALALLAALAPALASAALTRVPTPFSPITGSGSGLTIEVPGSIAIDETSTNVFLNDSTFRTDILGAEGGAPVGLVSPFTITGFSFPSFPNNNAIAVDNSATSPSKGTVYVVSGSGPTEVKKFQRNPATEQYEAAGGFPIPGAVSNAGATVDTQGNLFVADTESQSVFKFDAAGTLIRQYNLSSSVGRPVSVAVDAAGDLFVGRSASGEVFKYPADAFGEINPSNFVQISPENTGIAVDPARNALFIGLKKRVAEYDATTLTKKLEFGLGTLGLGPLGSTTKLAVDSTTNRVYVGDFGTDNVAVFGSPVPLPTVGATPATGVTATKATLNGTVDPEAVEVDECFFEYGTDTTYGQKKDCAEVIPTDSANHNVSAAISGLLPDGVTYHYRLVVTNENGTARSLDRTLVTAETVVTEAATEVQTTVATLNGTVFPEGEQFIDCKFEYGLTSNAAFEDEAPCDPSAGAISPDFAPHAVSAEISGLQPNAAYRFRLTAENADGTVSGDVLTFRATGPPQITEVRALDADQSSVTIEAKIDPRSFQTNYFFEWGPTTAYGNRIPANLNEPSAGSGEQPVPVTATLSGLAPASTYHYRVVAKSSAGTTASPDHELETLNDCGTLDKPGPGLPEGRCFELVSPRDPGPIAQPGRISGQDAMDWQASPQPGSLAYVVAAGLPGTTRGGQVMYKADRGSGTSGWSSSQISPPILTRNETKGPLSNPSKTLGLSPDLSCGVFVSSQPLTSDASTRALIDAGGSNLYRRNPDGSYTAITNLPPENPEAVAPSFEEEYALRGFSSNCGKVVFSSEMRYPGVPAAPGPSDQVFTYEWDEGVLRSIGVVPGPGGEEVLVPASAGEFSFVVTGTSANVSNAVSADGSRVFFSAKRLTSPNPAEIGNVGVFVRENGTVTRDLSMSETGTPNFGATYQSASKDGSRVFFTANAGLTDESSAAGTDLYEYNLDTDQLTDLSVAQDPSGAAGVAGFIGASRDGSHVYFVARGRLVPGEGRTFAENTAAKTFAVYGASGGSVSYAGPVTEADLQAGPLRTGLTVDSDEAVKTSRVSPDGRYLLFESYADVTGYLSGGVPEAYLYDALATAEPTICVSCRQDGKPSVTPFRSAPLGRTNVSSLNPRHDTSTLAIRDGKPVVFFSSYDRLATGGDEGNANLYQWSHDQVFLIASAPRGLAESETGEFAENYVGFVDASADATDLYFWIPARLNWENSDGRLSIYSARIGGGFAQPPAPPSPCNPAAEGSCQGSSTAPPAAPNAASTTFTGPGNPKARKPRQRKQKKNGRGKSRKQKGHKKQKGQKGKKQARQTNQDRRAGK